MNRIHPVEALESRTLFALTTFSIDPSVSSLRLSGNVAGVFDIEAQRDGSLIQNYQGSIVADVGNGVIRFSGGSSVVAQSSRSFEPGSGLANYGIEGRTDGIFDVKAGEAAIRNFAFDLESGDLALSELGAFSAGGLDVDVTNGKLEFDLTVGGDGDLDLEDKDADNDISGNATLRGEVGNQTLSIPIDVILDYGATDLRLRGTIVAKTGSGAPVDPNVVRIGEGTLLKGVQFTDADGTVSTVTIASGGTADVLFANATQQTPGKAGTVIVGGTGVQFLGIDATGTSPRTKLTITGKGGADGVVAVPSLVTDGSAALVGGKGVNFTGNLTVNGSLGTLTATGLTSATVTADSIGTAKIGRDITSSTITLDAPFFAGAFALRNLTVTGAINGSRVIATGAIGAVKAKTITSSDLYSGVNTPATRFPTTAELSAEGAIASVTTKTFSDSVIAADTLGKLKLTTVVTDNTGNPFGLTGDFITSLQTANASKQKLRLLLVDSPAVLDAQLAAQSFNAGDFTIRLA